MAELAALFGASFLAATLVPLPSEAALFAYLQFHPERTQSRLNPRAVQFVRRLGAPVTILAWLPIVGDALCVAAGWLRVNWIAALGFMAAGRLARYLVVAVLS